jgi:hypothetical protein
MAYLPLVPHAATSAGGLQFRQTHLFPPTGISTITALSEFGQSETGECVTTFRVHRKMTSCFLSTGRPGAS